MNIDLIETGDILHCRGRKLISRLIMRFTKSKWSHSALAFRIEGKLFVIDAQRDGVNLRAFEAWDKKYNYDILVTRHHDTNEAKINIQVLKARAFEKIGVTAYDFESLFLRYPWKLVTGSWKHRGNKEGKRMTCSEFVGYCLQHHYWYQQSPESIFRMCTNWTSRVITSNFE